MDGEPLVPLSKVKLEASELPLQVDREAQLKAPETLKEYPYYQLEEVILRHELEMEGVNYGGNGQDSVGVRLKLPGDKDQYFVKIFVVGDVVPKAILRDFLQKVGICREKVIDPRTSQPVTEEKFLGVLRSLTLGDSSESYVKQRYVERAAVGFALGHKLCPHRVPNLHAIWTWGGVPAAVSVEFIQGMHGDIFKSNPEYEQDVRTLEENDVFVDDTLGARNAVKDNNGHTWFIDLSFQGDIF